jgi:hypothetical protein
MRINPAIAFAGFGFALSVAPLVAHHSTAAVYDISKTITIQGTVTSVEWLNPHARPGMEADGRVINLPRTWMGWLNAPGDLRH